MGTCSTPRPLHDPLLLGKAFITHCHAFGMGCIGLCACIARFVCFVIVGGGFSPVTLVGGSADREEIPLRCREFMLPGQDYSDHSKLSARLSPVDVDSILEVPIAPDRANTLVWGDHDSGLYTVRSGYLFLRRPPSPFAPPLRLWKILAKLPTIPKVCSFSWRCGRDALHVGSRLRDAGLSDGACPLCGSGLEDTLHVLRDCPDSSTALRQAGFAATLISTDQTTATDWLGFAASSLSPSSLALLLTLLWASGDVGIPGCMSALSILCIFPSRTLSRSAMIIHCRLHPPRPAHRRCSPRWHPPPAGSVKINVDGAFLPSARLGAIGVLACDSSGAVLGGLARPVSVLGLASVVEASALFAGLEFAIASGWASALVESDAAVLINKLHRPTLDLSLLGDLLGASFLGLS
ncbi:hypothetical protein GQ457_18G009180 [Hibiscus cannabinus]